MLCASNMDLHDSIEAPLALPPPSPRAGTRRRASVSPRSQDRGVPRARHDSGRCGPRGAARDGWIGARQGRVPRRTERAFPRNSLLQDVRFGLRMMYKFPGLALLSVMTIAQALLRRERYALVVLAPERMVIPSAPQGACFFYFCIAASL